MFSELLTVFYEAANLVNERLIGRQPRDPQDGPYLSPNHLLLGNATARIPSGPFQQTNNLRRRHEFVQKIVDAFWKKWMQDYFPSLLIQQKWHVEKRNAKVNDIVLIQDSNTVRGNWKLGRVSKVFPSEDGKVRNVEVQYKNLASNKSDSDDTCMIGTGFTSFKRPVQRLIVLVPSDEVDADEN